MRLHEPQRHVEALTELLEIAVAESEPGDVTMYVTAWLGLAHVVRSDSRRLLAGLEGVLLLLSPPDAAKVAVEALRIADSQTGEPSALARLSVARWRRGRGHPRAALDLLDGPAAWAADAGHVEAEIAIRSEQGTCLLELGESESAGRMFGKNVLLLETAPHAAPEMLATARRNWQVALTTGAGSPRGVA